jgi:hypothetical protein
MCHRAFDRTSVPIRDELRKEAIHNGRCTCRHSSHDLHLQIHHRSLQTESSSLALLTSRRWLWLRARAGVRVQRRGQRVVDKAGLQGVSPENILVMADSYQGSHDGIASRRVRDDARGKEGCCLDARVVRFRTMILKSGQGVLPWHAYLPANRVLRPRFVRQRTCNHEHR